MMILRKIELLFSYTKFRTLILYALIGGFCAVLDFCVYTFLCCFNLLSYLYANVVSVHCGIFCSFFLNRSLNFRVKDKIPLRFFSFYVVGIVGLGISEVMLYIMVNQAGWNELICKLFSIVVVALTQFFLNKYITFRIKNENI